MLPRQCSHATGLPGTVTPKAKMSKIARQLHLTCPTRQKKSRKKSTRCIPTLSHLTIDSPGHLEGNCPFIYLDAFSRPDHFSGYLPEYASLDELKEHYTRGGIGDGTVKKLLYNVIEEELSQYASAARCGKRTYRAYMKYCAKARKPHAKPQHRLEEVRAAMKINYFTDKDLIEEQAKAFGK